MEQVKLQKSGTGLLLLAAVIVGIAIMMDSGAGRIVNGIGGLGWFASTALLVTAGVKARPPWWLWAVLAAVTCTVAFVVKPSALVPTLIGFVPAGFLMAAIAPHRKLLWATLVPACYLPAHIGTAVARAAVRDMMGHEAPIRTEPPPTAAFVPLLMTLCALLGGAIALRFLSQRGTAPRLS